MYYKPRLANGKLVQNPWPLRVYRSMNHVAWPLEDDASFMARAFDRLYYIFGLLLVLEHYDAEIRYFFMNLQNIDELLSGVPTTVILIEVNLRGYQLGLIKERLKVLLKEFYGNIFIENSENQKLCKNIEEKMRPTRYVSAFYFATLFLHASVPIVNFAYDIHEPLYKMIFAFDISPPYIFYTIILTNLWVGFNVVTFLLGELNLISQILLHLNGRFLMLRQDLENCSQQLLQKSDQINIAREFQLKIVNVIERNVALYKFAVKFQNEFSYRIFVWFALSAILLCALGFKVYTSPRESVSYIVWCIAKVVELCSIGELGSTLIKTTDEVSDMYYQSNWELIIARSSNKRENVRLMKLILVAMETSHKPIYLTGLNFFSVSLAAVITILQGAGSYFTCLIALR